MSKVRILSEVELELERYADYIVARGNPENALKWLERMQASFNSLSEFPERFPIYSDPKGRPTRYRTYIIDSHKVLYIYDQPSNIVIVASLLPAALDF